tara:strand:- start:58 stop:546 length:489 start_codon:yes stop_codon:yes gene_type:complete
MCFAYDIKKKLLWTVWVFSFAFSQVETNSYEVRKIRLENFKENYKGKSVRFTDQDSRFVQGVLMEVTDSDFVISIEGKVKFYNHKNINLVYIPPVSEDLYMAFGMSILGGLAGYLATIIVHPHPNNGASASISTIGIVLGFVLGKKTFYKSQKIDISGRLRG